MSVSFSGIQGSAAQGNASQKAAKTQFGCASHAKFGGAAQQVSSHSSQKKTQTPKFGIILGGAEIPLCAAICGACCCILPLIGAVIAGGKPLFRLLTGGNKG